jgi:hypothetical protein
MVLCFAHVLIMKHQLEERPPTGYYWKAKNKLKKTSWLTE